MCKLHAANAKYMHAIGQEKGAEQGRGVAVRQGGVVTFVTWITPVLSGYFHLR